MAFISARLIDRHPPHPEPEPPHAHPAGPADYKKAFSEFVKKFQSSASAFTSSSGKTEAKPGVFTEFWEAPSRIWSPRVRALSEAEIEAIAVSFIVLFH